jgi:hypothetical protein
MMGMYVCKSAVKFPYDSGTVSHLLNVICYMINFDSFGLLLVRCIIRFHLKSEKNKNS